jgi:archaemetzincin
MQRREMLYCGTLAGACVFMGWLLRARAASVADLPEPALYQRKADLIRHLFTAKHPPQPGDWLAAHPEPGQTFLEYTKCNPNRPTAGRRALYLVELGEFPAEQREVIGILREFMGLVFRLEIKSLPAIDPATIPATARRVNRQTQLLQFQTTHILRQVLLPRRPADAVAMLALTPTDLWPGEGWNFVFGQATLSDRVGVWSTARFGDPVKDAAGFRRRVLQVAVHETGHMFGMRHCTAYECGMNGSNSLAESDRAPLAFCPECEAKLWWVCSQNPARRAAKLADFADRHGLKDEAKLWRAEAQALEPPPK